MLLSIFILNIDILIVPKQINRYVLLLYVARTPIGLGVSKCPTRVVSETPMTLIRNVLDN